MPEDSLVDHRFLRCALDVLGAAAQLKDSEEVQWVVARRLFSKEPFLDFARSDPAARSFLLRAAFALLETAARRGIPVRGQPHWHTRAQPKLVIPRGMTVTA